MSLFRSAALALALAGLAAPALAQDKIVIGTEAAYPPFAYVLPSGELEGFDISIAKALCAQMQADCTIVNQAFDGLIPALNAKKIDAIIASMFVTEERLKAIDFAGPYYSVPGVFVAPKDTELELTEDSLGRRVTIGVQRGTTFPEYLKAKFPKARIQYYDTIDAGKLDLTSGRIDLLFADSVVLEDFLKSPDGATFAVLGEPVYDTAILGAGAGIGVRKGDTALKDKFDAALKALIASGEYKKINDQFIGVDIAPK